MRLGILLPRAGPLAAAAAVEATARAAEELVYASVWSTTVEQLVSVAASTRAIPGALLIGDSIDPADLTSSRQQLGRPIAIVAAPGARLGGLRPIAGDALLLSTSTRRPAAGSADGWAPRVPDAPAPDPSVWTAEPGQLVMPRIYRPPSMADLVMMFNAGVDQLVISLPAARTLDEQLAGFADIAERLVG